MKANINELVTSHKLISDQIDKRSLAVVLESLNTVLTDKIDGDVAELGCYIGTTSLFIQRLLNIYGCTKEFHVYDSFEGLPSKSSEDASSIGDDFKAGELKATKKAFQQQFQKTGLKVPYIHKAWFNNLNETDLPGQLAFAFIDGDFYESILVSLRLVWPRLSTRGIICIDDYKREALPGVEKAVIDYFGHDVIVTKRANIGVLRKTAS